jgi:hypothetical protein
MAPARPIPKFSAWNARSDDSGTINPPLSSRKSTFRHDD